MKRRNVCLLTVPKFRPGDPRPRGYTAVHEWAKVQLRAGLVQRRCPVCGLWPFPQERCCSPSLVELDKRVEWQKKAEAARIARRKMDERVV